MSKIEPFVISRVFKAPRELVYAVNSRPEHQLPVLAPAGSDLAVSKMDFRVGGTHHYAMDAGGTQMWGMQTYVEIVPGHKIVLIQSFSDKDGGLGVHPMSPNWPKKMLATMVFEDAPEGQCKMTVSWLPYESDETGDATFDAARGSMTQGFGHQFQVVDAYLAKLQA